MKFCIISHVVHAKFNNKFFAYGPYVREMNLWLQEGMQLIIVAPICENKRPTAIELAYNTKNVHFIAVPQFNLTSVKELINTFKVLPQIIRGIYKGMKKADHIHLRCPGNMGLLGAFLQILFPKKKKTAKYAGNWDWNSRQPWSYRLQQRILRNTYLTRNMQVLVYGDWPDRTKNIKPFFTASYSEADKTKVIKPDIHQEVRLAFVGTLSLNKSPETALKVLKLLSEKNMPALLTYSGDGPEKENLVKFAAEWQLQDKVVFLGNVSAEKVKEVLQQSHFLVFISRSEGWPKAVAEAMWWGCVPITTAVSCVPQMLGNGERGFLVENKPEEIAEIIMDTISNSDTFIKKSNAGMKWAREYTLERFESEIKKLIYNISRCARNK